ncbi:MAG: PHP domain-containing protein [Thermoplasmata archaeon]|nr:PHP domain-containing protein [Thermoplasmata archaeon]
MRGLRRPSRFSVVLTSSVLSILVIISLAPSLGFEGERTSPSGESYASLTSETNYSVAIGDGHMHSIYSTGETTVHENSDVAKSRSLNWIVVTDHNVVPPQSVCDAENTADFLCLIGDEVTTSGGDILGWGLSQLVPWNLGPGRNMNDIFEDIRTQGGLAVLAHPMAPGGKHYQHFGVYENFDGLEIYHGYSGFNADPPTRMDSDAVSQWESYLNAGIRKIAVGDSDCHNASNQWNEGDLFNRQGAIGFPRNVVLVEELSREGILEAVSKGRLYITDGPVLNFTIDGHILGETIRSSAPATLNVSISGYANKSTSRVDLIRNGSVIGSWFVGAGWFSIQEATAGDSDYWYRAEIRTNTSSLLKGETYVAFSNPVFFDLEPYDLPPAPPENLMAELNGNDVSLSWNPSPSADVDRYNIYVSDSYGNFSFLYPVAKTVSTNWTHEGAGIGNDEDFFYVVRAVDKMGYEDNNTRKAAKTSRFLAGGKHLISFPVVPANDSLGSVLQTVGFDRVWTYDSSGWTTFSSFKVYSALRSMTHTSGYWVNVTQDSHFVLAGAVPVQTTIQLREGWNLVSYPSFIQADVADLMAGMPLQRVEGPAGGPPHFLRRYSALDTLQSFQGYWFEVSANATWVVQG